MTTSDHNADTKAAVSTLNGLIETCKDGANGFRSAADGVEEVNLQRLFTSYAQQRGEFAVELSELVSSLGGDASDGGHIAGAIHRGWINLKAAITGKDDAAIVSECERGEDFAKKRYMQALEEQLPAAARTTVERQFMQVKEAHDHVRSLQVSLSKK